MFSILQYNFKTLKNKNKAQQKDVVFLNLYNKS